MNTELRQIVETLFGKANSTESYIANKARLNSLLPNFVYKYRTLNKYSVENVCNRSLWFDSLLNMNDPYEGRHTYNNPLRTPLTNKPDFLKLLSSQGQQPEDNPLIEEFLEGEVTLEDILKKNLPGGESLSHMISAFERIHEQGKEQFHNNFLKHIFICSLSEKYNSVLMWSHYTNNHSGFCIEYDLSKVSPLNHFRNFLYPVLYDSQMFDISNFIERDKGTSEYNNLYILQAVIRKSLDWSYEHEWRVVHPFGALTQPQNLHTPKPSSILLGSNFFNGLNKINNITAKKHDIELAIKLTSYCEKEQIPLEITKISSKEYLIERESISYDEIYKKLTEL